MKVVLRKSQNDKGDEQIRRRQEDYDGTRGMTARATETTGRGQALYGGTLYRETETTRERGERREGSECCSFSVVLVSYLY